MTDPASEGPDPAVKKLDVLSFKAVGKPLSLAMLENEFQLMLKACGKVLTTEIVTRVCLKSGTHLIKLVSPRTDGDHAVLRVAARGENAGSPLLPSVNAPDIPFAKIIFRPLEIIGRTNKSVVDHVLCPDEVSEEVFHAFSAVFGIDVLDALKVALLSPAPAIEKLSGGEFPIIFIPTPAGGDLQITPVSPAAAYMAMKEVTGQYFLKQEPNAPRVPRGRWHKQAVSSKPQNISGAIGGPRVRFLAEMPAGLVQYDSELYRYVHGGRFPRLRNIGLETDVLHYADLVDRDREYNNQDTRRGLDGLADQLIDDVRSFIRATSEDARQMAESLGFSDESLKPPPRPAEILLSRIWPEGGFDRARRVLSGAHFEYRENQKLKGV